MAHVDYQGATPTITRRLALGNSSNVSQDTTFAELGPAASEWVDHELEQFVASVPFSSPYPDYVVYLTSARVAQMYGIEKAWGKDRMDIIDAEVRRALDAAIKAAKAQATTRTKGPLAFGSSWETPLITETDWDGTNATNGPTL